MNRPRGRPRKNSFWNGASWVNMLNGQAIASRVSPPTRPKGLGFTIRIAPPPKTFNVEHQNFEREKNVVPVEPVEPPLPPKPVDARPKWVEFAVGGASNYYVDANYNLYHAYEQPRKTSFKKNPHMYSKTKRVVRRIVNTDGESEEEEAMVEYESVW